MILRPIPSVMEEHGSIFDFLIFTQKWVLMQIFFEATLQWKDAGHCRDDCKLMLQVRESGKTYVK